MFKPPKSKPIFSEDSKVLKKRFILLRNQIFIFSILCYIMYYFTRKSTDLAGTALMENGGLTTQNFALMGMFFSITYGLSKFIIGGFADRSSGRMVMTFGLLISATINLAMGGVINFNNGQMSLGPIVMMIILLIALGIFQGMGWPATARMFSHWFTDKERSVRLAFWNCGQGLGSAILPLVVIGILELIGDDKIIYGLYYWIPSLIAFLFIPFIFWALRDRPESEGLPTVENWKGIKEEKKEKVELKWKEIFFKYVLKNKLIWILGFANIWVYVLRQGISYWLLKLVKDQHGIVLKDSKFLWSFFEWAGICGGIIGAYLAKWLFKNRKAPVMIFGLIITICGLVMFQYAPYKNIVFLSFSLIISGFGVYMPQAMIGSTAIELTNKKAAATASGFTGLLGYFGDAVMSKPVIAAIAGKNNNWDYVFYYFYVAAVLGVISLAFLWNKNERNKLI